MQTHTYDIHLVCGCPGAGKSTFSLQLTQDLGAIRFAIDEWMQCLHNGDKPDHPDFEWYYDRVQRDCLQMRRMAEQIVLKNIPVVFDNGFINSRERAIFVDWAQEHGFSTRLYYVDVPADIRWQRVQKRNDEQMETYQFEVTRDMFDGIAHLWEPPSEKEMHHLNGVRIKN